jgi:glutaminyl-tRNA synthetase
LQYFRKATKFDVKEFEEFCGVGVEVSAAQISAAVKSAIDAAGDAGWSVQFKLLPEINKALKWADGALVLAELEAQLTKRFGAKPAAGDKKTAAAAAKPAPKPTASAAPAASTATAAGAAPAAAAGAEVKKALEEEDDFADSARDLKAAHNTEEQRKRCLDATKGVIYTRFPPEPNVCAGPHLMCVIESEL